MKFAGLILICASSCLALILPAVGVVQFPKMQPTAFEVAATDSGGLPASVPVMAQNIPISIPSNQPWIPATPQGNFLPGSNAIPMSPFPGATANPPSLPPAILNNALPLGVDANLLPQASAPNLSSNKVGVGIWLLLAPICLLGLAMWTFAPNPSGSRLK